MAYQGDDRHGGDRWREREGGRYGERGSERDPGRGYQGGGYRAGGPGRGGYGRDEDDRGFLDRAGDEVRSWFGDEEAQRRREEDERHWAREQRLSGHRNNDSGYGETGERPGGGWGNQRGDSWHRDRPGERGWLGGSASDEGYDRHPGYGARQQRGDYEASSGGAGSGDLYGYNRAPGGASGFGGAPDPGRRYESSGRNARGAGIHDPHYAQWRQRQIDEIDRDYEDYRREHHARFEQEFGDWRSKRQSQRQSLAQVGEHMDVVGSDGTHVGTVDKVRGDRVILARHDPNAGGIHHSIPCSWVESVDDKVVLNRSAEEATRDWRSEERNRALFEREDSGSDGPHFLDGGFSGTYAERADRKDRDATGDPE
ncbi:MAG: hypothetical protein JWP15_45 [Alphaproteobacteria bacterium]|nr:hypothetical protein [Alphaproteobacteria bacterium]